MIHLLKLSKVQIYGRRFSSFLFLSFLAIFTFALKKHRASRKYHRKTLLYVSGLGMMIFIFIAALLVQNMDGFTATQSFLDSHKATSNQTILEDGKGTEGYGEVYLLVSILCYNSFSAFGVMILPWTLISELYPIQVSAGNLNFT